MLCLYYFILAFSDSFFPKKFPVEGKNFDFYGSNLKDLNFMVI